MTTEEQKRIERLRKNGNSYRKIAEITGLAEGTVKMYCSRNGIRLEEAEERACLQCGRKFTPKKTGRTQTFCSSNCRVLHWRRHLEKSKDHNRTCPCCGKVFLTYRTERKYCSHGCYINARFGEAMA